MKKSIFDLDRKELKKIDLNCRRTDYYRQYLLLAIFCSLLTLVMVIVTVTGLEAINPKLADTCELFIYLFGFALILIIALLFGFKRFDLEKKYYEEKVEK